MLSVPSASGADACAGVTEPAVLHRHRAAVSGVDADHRPGHVAGIVRGQEAHDPGDLVGIGQPAHGHGRRDLGQQSIGDGLGPFGLQHRGVDLAGADGVDPNPVGGMIHRQRPGEVVDGALRGAVRGDTCGSEVTPDRSEVDDRTTTGRLHRPQRGAAHVERPADVDSHDPAPIARRWCLHRWPAR